MDPDTQVELARDTLRAAYWSDEIPNLNKVIGICSDLIELHPNNAYAYHSRSLAFIGLKRFDEAVADLERLLEMHDSKVCALSINGLATAYSKLGTILSKRGNFSEAITNFNRAINLEPEEALRYAKRGRALQAMGDSRGAWKDYMYTIGLVGPPPLNTSWPMDFIAGIRAEKGLNSLGIPVCFGYALNALQQKMLGPEYLKKMESE